MKNNIVVSKLNVELIIHELNFFIKSQEKDTFVCKRKWGIPDKNINWKSSPADQFLEQRPLVQKHPESTNSNDCLIAIKLGSFEASEGFLTVIGVGDKILPTLHGFIVLPAKVDSIQEEVRSFGLFTN
ncbi:MAG: hypothetical protein ACI9AR_000483 [Flavobacteriaceae bacterium]|jgi:hypothetical protein